MRYEEVQPISREDAVDALSRHDEEEIANVLVRLAYFEEDWTWVQDLCIHFAEEGTPLLRSAAVLCLGHVARVHGTIDLNKVVPLCSRLLCIPELKGRVEDALSDISMFATGNVRLVPREPSMDAAGLGDEDG